MIRTTGLRKSFGDRKALDGLTMRVEEGDIYGFVGPNGAGKTTTIRILATLLQPDAGEAFVCGYSVLGQARFIRQRIGYVPDYTGLYDEMTVHEYLHFFAALYEIDRNERERVVGDVLSLTDLDGLRDVELVGLSRGMRQRLAIARVLLHDPQVLLLDEPAAGLDPRARIELRELLRELRSMGKTILISSHILSELEEMCTRIGFLEQGRLVHEGRLQDVFNRVRHSGKLEVRVAARSEEAVALLSRTPGVGQVKRVDERIEVELAADKGALQAGPEAVARVLVEAGFSLVHLRELEVRLEEAFIKLTRGVIG